MYFFSFTTMSQHQE